jgi:hypothetical protein
MHLAALLSAVAFSAMSLGAEPAALTVTPERAPATGTLDLSCTLQPVPARAEVVVTDAYRGTELLRISRPLTSESGGAKARLAYAAEPGAFAVRLESPRGTTIAGPGHFFVPGITKRGAWWLFSGQPMCGAIRTWGGVAGEAEKLVQPLYKGGYGFNVLTLELHETMLGKSDADRRRNDWPILERNGAYGFALPGELGWEGLSGALAPEKKRDHRENAFREGGFMSEKNRAAVLDYMRRVKQSQFPDGRVSEAFLGFCAFENHMGFGPWFDYSPSAIAAYRAEMKAAFKTIDVYNRACGTAWKSWEELDAPRDPASTRRDWAAWTDDRFRGIARFYAWLQPAQRQLFPDTYLLPIVGGMLGTMQNDDWVTGANAFVACDEREVAKVVDVIGTEGWADYVAGHSDLLLAATDPEGTGVPQKPIWPDYYTYLSIGSDIPRSLILKRVDQIGHGATGTFMEHVGAVYEMGKREPAFLEHLVEAAAVNRFLSEKANLFIGAVPRIDVALVTPTDTLKYGRDKDTVRDADNTNAGLAHALTRLHRGKRWLYQDTFSAESARRYPAVMATLGALVGDRFLAEAEKYVTSGGMLYLEGLPERNLHNEPAPHRLDTLIGAKVTAATPGAAELIVPAGVTGGQPLRLAVRRLATIEEVGPAVEILAKFADDSPAVLTRKVGRGLVIWAPHHVVRDASFAYIQKITRQREKPFDFWAGFDVAYCGYYDAVLRRIGIGGLAVAGAGNDAVRAAILRTTGGSTLLSLVNYGAAKDLRIELAGGGDYLADLRTGQAMSYAREETGGVIFPCRIDANRWTFIALAKDRASLEAEISRPLYRIRATEP